MIYGPHWLYLGSAPKTATTATERALRSRWPDSGIRIGPVTGHAQAWQIPAQTASRRLVWATIAPPLLWYSRVYLHAVDTRSVGMLDALRAYGQGRTDPMSVIYGMTHPTEVSLPSQQILIQPVHATSAVVDLQTRGCGLWSWALDHYLGATCPTPADHGTWGVDALVDCLQLAAGIAEVMGEHLDLEIVNARSPKYHAWLADHLDLEIVTGWIEQADSEYMDRLGYEAGASPMIGGPVWREDR